MKPHKIKCENEKLIEWMEVQESWTGAYKMVLMINMVFSYEGGSLTDQFCGGFSVHNVSF